MGDYSMTVDLNGCERCHGDGHPGITFTPLTHPVEIGDTKITHWTPCPTNGEPILLATIQETFRPRREED